MHGLTAGLLEKQTLPCWVCPPGSLQLTVTGPNKGWAVHGSMLQDWAGNTSALPQNAGCYTLDVGTHRVSWCKNPWEKEEAWIYLQVSFERVQPWIDQIHLPPGQTGKLGSLDFLILLCSLLHPLLKSRHGCSSSCKDFMSWWHVGVSHALLAAGCSWVSEKLRYFCLTNVFGLMQGCADGT